MTLVFTDLPHTSSTFFERNLDYKDIAIISRKRSDKINKLYNMLKEYKIPVSIKYKEKVYDSSDHDVVIIIGLAFPP